MALSDEAEGSAMSNNDPGTFVEHGDASRMEVAILYVTQRPRLDVSPLVSLRRGPG